jgi:DHA2 family multidrug resistance protein
LVARLYTEATNTGIAALNGEVTRQASMIAYVDDYWLMMILTFAVIPLLLLVRKPKGVPGAAPTPAEAVHID